MAINPIDITLEVAESALAYCGCDDRDDWTNCGMALKAEFGDAAFDVFDAWSQTGAGYKAADTKAVWKSFKGSQIGIGTLIFKAKEAGFKFEKREMSNEDRDRLEKERAEKMKAREAQEKIEEKNRDEYRAKLSDALTSAVNTTDGFSYQGKSEYLDKKQVGAFGVLFPNRPLIVVNDEKKCDARVLVGHEAFSEFINLPDDQKPVHRIIRAGAMIVPLYDEKYRINNFQVIYNTGRKRFLKGRKQGCFFIVGQMPQHGRFNVAFAEGYANAASIHMALQCPVVVCFDAGNMKPVAQKILELWGEQINQYLFCADDDSHLKTNKGLQKASEAAALVSGLVVLPVIDPIAKEEDAPDSLYTQAVEFVVEKQKVSISAIQRELKIGYNRAAHIVDYMQNNKIVSKQNEKGKREVLIAKPV